MEASQAVPTNSDVNFGGKETSSAAAWLMLFIMAVSPHLVGVDKLQDGLHGARVVLLQPQRQQQRPAPAALKAFLRPDRGNHVTLLSLLADCGRGTRLRAVWEHTTHRVEADASGTHRRQPPAAMASTSRRAHTSNSGSSRRPSSVCTENECASPS